MEAAPAQPSVGTGTAARALSPRCPAVADAKRACVRSTGRSDSLSSGGSVKADSKSVVRRWEFYEFAGEYSPVDHSALCADVTCTAPAAGELGAYIGAQMASATFGVLLPETVVFQLTGDADAFTFVSGGGLSGERNPTLQLQRGGSYTFVVSNGADHPLCIQGLDGRKLGNPEGVLANCDSSVTFVVPQTAQGQLQYACKRHSTTFGYIAFVDAAYPPPPPPYVPPPLATNAPTSTPTTATPTRAPSTATPTNSPTAVPSLATATPTAAASGSASPNMVPTARPTAKPTARPSRRPTARPSAKPTSSGKGK